MSSGAIVNISLQAFGAVISLMIILCLELTAAVTNVSSGSEPSEVEEEYPFLTKFLYAILYII